jgi:hypothetical protein
MPVIPTRFPANFGEVFPLDGIVLGVEPSTEASEDPTSAGPKAA